jgi:hypothetical protein
MGDCVLIWKRVQNILFLVDIFGNSMYITFNIGSGAYPIPYSMGIKGSFPMGSPAKA